MDSNQRLLYNPIGKFSQSLLCKICNNLTIDPVECIQCENLYCKECYLNSKSKQDQCPEDNCKGPFQTKLPHRMIRDQLSKIQFYCINHNEGCNKELTQENILKHFAECPYHNILCKCGKNIQRKNLESHKNICLYHQTQNCIVCKQTLNMEQLKNHKCINELQKMINEFQEKFQDYKEQSNYSILELKNQQNQRINELNSAKQQMITLQDENKQLKNELLQQFQLFKEFLEKIAKQKQMMEKQQQQIQPITKGELIESNKLFCDNKHKLSFWKNPSGEEKKKNCTKCQKQNTTCRYFCSQCSIFFCLKCCFPELKIDKQPMQTFCPIKHQMNQISDDFRCSVCDKKGEDMIQPIAFQCTTCEFRICIQCIKNKKFQEIN